MQTFLQVLDKYRTEAGNSVDKGARFERLMKAYLLTEPRYANLFKKVWLWNEFPSRTDFGQGQDTGIDLVALTHSNEYWAIQCKFYNENAIIDRASVDSFLAASSRNFKVKELDTLRHTSFAHRLWISTTNHWNTNAEEVLRNQNPPVTRINLHDLLEATVDWEALEKGIHGKKALTEKKKLFPHQIEVRNKVCEYLKEHERGKLIMACGTGKTFTSLKIAEEFTKYKGNILYLVPSIALIGQTLREWTSQSDFSLYPICVCSDPKITQDRKQEEDYTSVIDLAYPASTNVDYIIKQFQEHKDKGMLVVFSTYQSIEVVAEAQQKEHGLPEFDLIICDEAHRTTGYSEAGEESSNFTKVHDNNFIKAKRRLYMTATPRLYSTDAKTKAKEANITLWSMDDETHYGKEIYRLGFGDAVEKGLLSDYKVIILTLNDKDVPPAVQRMIANGETEIKTDDLTKLIGTISALAKQFLGNESILEENDPSPMKRAVAFCGSIKNSEQIASTYNLASEHYLSCLPEDTKNKMVNVKAKHIDGSMPTPQRDEILAWLKQESENRECRILTNVRVLSEGVDVPSLDAVLFLSAKNSQIDVVQSVGRVMRKAPHKKYGYIIIPVIVPSDIEPEKALDDNERYKVVWTVLNALRAHDDRFNAIVNKIELNKKRPPKILIGSPDTHFDEEGKPSSKTKTTKRELAEQLVFQFEQLKDVIYAKLVQKVGERRYWEEWAKDVAVLAQRQIERIKYLIEENEMQKTAFEKFLLGLQKNINPSINQDQAIEMLAQHIITQPIFEALFEGYSFAKSNPVSIAMQNMLDKLEKGSNLAAQDENLNRFYESVRKRAEGIDNAEGKQRIIIELYDKFFKIAFPKMVERLGIVYTPIEVVDFILHSVNDVLKKEFDRTLSEPDIHILDPFTGTGTFIVRLIQTGLIKPEDLKRKYKKELHANEIVLLAYYIACVNIENAFHDVFKTNTYLPFEGIVLTDTFQLGEMEEADKLFSEMFPQNSKRVENQKKAPIRIIIGNPPYSVGQKSANDNAQNLKYPKLEQRIAETYAKLSNATNKNSLYDTYIKAFRWSSDRLDKTGGIICFVSNAGWLDGNAMDGFRKSLEKEFTSIYVFNLRGNARTSGDARRKEAGNVFGSGSRTPVSITLLVKNPNQKTEKATIYYHDIGDYLSREEKLKKLQTFRSFANPKMQLQILQPTKYADWISKRNDLFEKFIPLEPKEKLNEKSESFFVIHSMGVATSRDTWVYNFSTIKLLQNMEQTINFYNEQVSDYKKAISQNNNLKVEDFINKDPKKISWSSSLIPKVERGVFAKLQTNKIYKALYRPFCVLNLYFGEHFIHRRAQFDILFPTPNSSNLVITVLGAGGNKDFSTLIVNQIPDLQLNFNTQCFPLYYYEESKVTQKSLFDKESSSSLETKEYVRKEAVSDYILQRAKGQYVIHSKELTKEDIFYYVYGFLHSPEYRKTFASDLKKSLPRIPLVETKEEFWAFSTAGRKLAELHLNYEKIPPYKEVQVEGDTPKDGEDLYKFYEVSKMRFINKNEKHTILYNPHITLRNIPPKAYEYIVNGKSAIEWILERYQITTHKESGITNNPNDWAKEVGNPRYILDLLLSVIHLSIQTMEIVEKLPKLNLGNGK